MICIWQVLILLVVLLINYCLYLVRRWLGDTSINWAKRPQYSTSSNITQHYLICLEILPGHVTVHLTYLDRKRARGLLPGPSLLPIIENLHLAPSSKAWNTYTQWFKQYGPIYRFIYGQQTSIMLGDNETAYHLFDKRGNIYSSSSSSLQWYSSA